LKIIILFLPLAKDDWSDQRDKYINCFEKLQAYKKEKMAYFIKVKSKLRINFCWAKNYTSES
jgi:hypothetical protein